MTRTVRIILCALCVGMLSGCSIVGTWESESVEPAEDAKAFNIATATFNDDMTFSCRATCGGSGEMRESSGKYEYNMFTRELELEPKSGNEREYKAWIEFGKLKVCHEADDHKTTVTMKKMEAEKEKKE